MLTKEIRKKLRLKNYNYLRRLKNLESERKRGRDYYKENRKTMLKSQHEYYFKNIEKKRLYNKKYHEVKKKLGGYDRLTK